MDIACFETLMKVKGWENPTYGLVPQKDDNYGNTYSVTDLSFKAGTRTVFVNSAEVGNLDAEDFDMWYQEKTKGFIF